METFTYSAIDQVTGREQRGSVEGTSRGQAAALLKQRGLAPIVLELLRPAQVPRPGRRRIGWIHGRVVGRKRLMHFTRQLATLVNAGLPLTRSLEVLRRQERHPKFQAVLADLEEAISGGGSFSESLRRHPRLFDPLYVTMARAGEAGGVLGTVLERQAQFLEKSERLRGRVKAAMTYPVIVMSVAVSILWVLMVMVVPKFELIFSGLLKGQALPGLTRLLLDASSLVRGHFVICLGAGGALVLASRLLLKTAKGRWIFDGCVLRLPVMGELALKAAVARVTRTLGSLLACGVPILDALAISRATSGNVRIAAALYLVNDRIKQGDGIAGPLEETGIFPELVAGMIQVGEETGALPDMLRKTADAYDEEVDAAVNGLTAILEPVMIVAMAAVVGVIVIALFLPIVSIIQHLQ